MKKSLLIITLVIIAISIINCRKVNPVIPKNIVCMPCGEVAVFTDPVIESAMKTFLNKGSCDICVSDLPLVTTLSLSGTINSFSGIEKLTNLQTLTIQNATINCDFTYVGQLSKLTELDIYTSTISDMTGLGNATAISTLTITNCSNINMSVLTQLTNIHLLNLESNNITSISALSTLTGLTYVDIANNQITSLDGLKNATNIQTLKASINKITITADALTSLTNVQYLDLNTNQITDLSGLIYMTNLQTLKLGGNLITDITPLQGLTSLHYVWLANNYISSTITASSSGICPLASNTGITSGDEIYLGSNPITQTASTDTCYLDLESRGVYIQLW